MKKSISSLLSLTQETFAVCDVTGIPIAVSFPNHGIDFAYKSPFVKYNNILKVTALAPSQIRALPKVILAGITLSVLSHHNLLNRHEISAVEANVYFQLVPSHTLLGCIKFFTSPISQGMLEILPKISIDSMKDKVQYSTKENVIENYVKACREIINPTPSQSVSITTTSVIDFKPKSITVKALTPELRREAKEVLSHLSTDFLMSPKLLSILKIVVQKENLITLGDEMRAKIISRLEPMETSYSNRMIQILTLCQKPTSHAEVEKKDVADNIGRLSDAFEIVTKRKSLAEILASKTQNKA